MPLLVLVTGYTRSAIFICFLWFLCLDMSTQLSLGRGMASTVVAQKHLWLTLSHVPDRDRAVKQTQAVSSIITRRDANIQAFDFRMKHLTDPRPAKSVMVCDVHMRFLQENNVSLEILNMGKDARPLDRSIKTGRILHLCFCK